MSYRTYVNDVQIFGNNDYFQLWLDFIKQSGIKIGPEGQYEGYLDDFMAAMAVCENIVLEMEAEIDERRAKLPKSARNTDWERRHAASLFDLSRIKRKIEEDKDKPDYKTMLFDELFDLEDTGYLFMPMALYRACQDDLVLDVKHKTRFRAYKLKPGRRIHVRAD